LIESFWFWFQKYGKIDIVVSNAAVNPSTDSILETQESVLDKLWEINVKAAILLLKVILINIMFTYRNQYMKCHQEQMCFL